MHGPFDCESSQSKGLATLMTPPAPVVLFVDDDPLIHDFYRMFAESCGYMGRFAYTGREAVLAAMDSRPDIIVLDMHMPGLQGTEVLRYIRDEAKTADVPVIFVTAQPRDLAAPPPPGHEAAVEYLTKPVDRVSLKTL